MFYREEQRMKVGELLEQKLKSEQKVSRNVRCVLRVRLVDLSNPEKGCALLSWWQPSEEIVNSFSEGQAVALYNVTPGNLR